MGLKKKKERKRKNHSVELTNPQSKLLHYNPKSIKRLVLYSVHTVIWLHKDIPSHSINRELGNDRQIHAEREAQLLFLYRVNVHSTVLLSLTVMSNRNKM